MDAIRIRGSRALSGTIRVEWRQERRPAHPVRHTPVGRRKSAAQRPALRDIETTRHCSATWAAGRRRHAGVRVLAPTGSVKPKRRTTWSANARQRARAGAAARALRLGTVSIAGAAPSARDRLTTLAGLKRRRQIEVEHGFIVATRRTACAAPSRVRHADGGAPKNLMMAARWPKVAPRSSTRRRAQIESSAGVEQDGRQGRRRGHLDHHIQARVS